MSTGTEASVARGLAFLAERQRPDGGFTLRYGLDGEEGEPDDHALFGTALVAYSLGFCGDAAAVVRDRAVAHLVDHMEPGGVWRHWTPGHEQYHLLAADADDTACASLVLRAQGVPFPDNRGLLLGNRDPDGRFYTWFVIRRPLPRRLGLWRIGLKRLRRPIASRALWKVTWAQVHDKDTVVNANVLAYLGDGPHAGPVVAHIADVFRRRQEHACDIWYRGALTFQWAVSRAWAAGVTGLGAIREESRERILALRHGDGRIGDGPLDTARAICALDQWGAGVPEDAWAYLESAQRPDGSWPAAALYFAGPRADLPGWGSAEVTTAVCLEALARREATAPGSAAR